MIKLIATDMDGTWLREDKTYDKELFEKEFQIMQDRDIKFVIASGNQYENILDRFPKANKHMYFVAENGALVAHGNEILQISDLSDKDYQTMLEIVEKLPYKAIVAGVTSAYVEKSSGKEFAEDLKKYVKKIQVVDSFNDIDDRIFKVSLRVPEDEMPKVLDKLREDYPQISFVSGASTAIDMQTKGMNKAVGLEYLGKKLKIKSSEMVTFGDSGNDVGMLKFAGSSFATATALPEAKKAANQIIGSSEESSVQKKILELLS